MHIDSDQLKLASAPDQQSTIAFKNECEDLDPAIGGKPTVRSKRSPEQPLHDRGQI